jgi:hypothetical protein
MRAPGAPLLSGVFVALLRADRKEYFRIVADVADHINPLCRGIHSGMAFFIDNGDEMFHRSIQDAVGASRGAGGLGDRLGEVWALAQLGLARASFDMSRINPHIRVYSSLRRDAWLRLGDFDPNAAQVNGRALEVSYTADDLKAIFLKNVENEPAENLVEPPAADPLARFVGTENLQAVHDYARRPEHILDFILRQTLLRPRDLMLVGERLSDAGPARRRGVGAEEAIYQAAAQVADWYQGEMSLFVYRPDRRLYQPIDRNVLTRDDLARIARDYRELVASEEAEHAREEAGHPFCSLYKLGLLGVIRDPRDAAPDSEAPVQRQRFAGPDEIVAEGRVGILPQSPVYLVHPSLNLTIEAAHGTDYLRNFETRNIIGHGYPWVEDAIVSYVLRGDIVGSRRTAENPEYAQRYPMLFRHWVEQECAKLGVRHHTVEGGDSLLLVDGSAAKLLAVARAVLMRMHRFADHPCTMRFGAASGVVHGLGSGPVTGSVLGTAARLEPTAQHDTVVATDGFWEDARAAWGDRAAKRLDASFKAFRYQDGKFQIRKNRADPATESGLWRIRLLPD